MTASHIELDKLESLPHFKVRSTKPLIEKVLKNIRPILGKYTQFNLIFFAIASIEFLFLILFFTFLTKSALLSLSLAVIFLTFFSYFTLRTYLEAKKKGQLQEEIKEYIQACSELLKDKDTLETHLALANSSLDLAEQIFSIEDDLYTLSFYKERFSQYFQMIGLWCHGQDLFLLKEELFLYSVNENIKIVRAEPTSPKSHASLAGAYIALASIYQDPSVGKEGWLQWIYDSSFKKQLKIKHRKALECAVEEFKIMKEFAPRDSWIHTQLAYSYRDLEMPLEEMVEYEALMAIEPTNVDILFKLGALYFQLGFHAKGLKIYEQLQLENSIKAEEMLKHYHDCLQFFKN